MEKVKLTQTVTSAQTGDNAALEALYREYAKPVYFLALKILANKEDAEDITQDVFIHMFQKIADLKTPETFPTWLNRITSNKCTDFLRKRKITLNIADEEIAQTEFFEETDPLLVPEKSLDNAETVKIITDIIDGLPLPQRVCVYYYYYEHLTIAQIAENLATNESTVKNRLALAREKIRKAVEKLEKDEGIKLYGVMPLMLTPILRIALQQFQMPQGAMTKILDGVVSTVDTPIDGTATVTEIAADGIAKVTETATAGTTATETITTGTVTTIKSSLSIKAIAGIVAGVAVICGITMAVIFGNFGNDAEPAIADAPEVTTPVITTTTPTITEPVPDLDPEPDTEITSAENNEWRYFRTVEGIFKSNEDGTEIIQLTEAEDSFSVNAEPGRIIETTKRENIGNLVVVDDWIYFILNVTTSTTSRAVDDGTVQQGDGVVFRESTVSSWGANYYLYRIRTDGTEKTALVYDSGIINLGFDISGDWIYYSIFKRNEDYEESGGLYRMRLDGTNNTIINGDIVSNSSVNANGFTISGDWIYYIDRDNEGGLCKVHTDGTGREVLIDWNIFAGDITRIEDDWIYLMIASGPMGWDFYRIRTDGTGFEEIN